MIHFISFADRKFEKTLERIKNEAILSNFFDTVKVFNEDSLDEEHVKYCFENPRGFGFWSWKSMITWQNFNTIEYGDILVYSDAGGTINPNGGKRFKEYLDYLNKHDSECIFFQMQIHLERQYTKMDLFNYLDSHEFLDTGQLSACSFLIKKTERTVELVNKWKEICQNHRNFIDDSNSVSKNHDSFIDNRHDQSVLSLLVKKMKFNTIIDETWKIISDGDQTYPLNCTRIRF